MARLVAAVVLTVVAVAVTRASADSFTPYANYSVGGAAGWLFDAVSNKPRTNYSAWASRIIFSVGDYLIFKSNGNSTVIQTYNRTTYNLCSLDQDYSNLTSQWTSDNADDDGGSAEDPIPVLLSKEGENYFFSSPDNGAQCRNGMKFHIVVFQRTEPPLPSPSLAPASPPSVTIKVNSSDQRETQTNVGGRQGRGLWALSSFIGILLLLISSG